MPELTTFHDVSTAFVYIKAPKDPNLVAWYQGQRYDGFVNEDNVKWFAEKNGWKWEDVRIERLDAKEVLGV